MNLSTMTAKASHFFLQNNCVCKFFNFIPHLHLLTRPKITGSRFILFRQDCIRCSIHINLSILQPLDDTIEP